MTTPDDERDRAERLIERLLVDAAFRAEFRADPAGSCRALGLDELAAELSRGSRISALEGRESKSSLAGVVMAVAAEGVAVAELQGLLHGHVGQGAGVGRRVLGAAHVKAPRGPRLPGVLRGPRGLLGGSGAHHTAGAASPPGPALTPSPGAPAPSSTTSAAAGAPAPSSTTSAAAGAPASTPPPPGTPVAASAAPPVAPGPSAAGATAGVTGAAGTGSPHAPWPTAPPAGATPASAPSAGGVLALPTPATTPTASASALALLQNPRLQMPASAQTLFSSGQADPRLVALLQSTLTHHTITLTTAETITDPVHAQAIDITSVDGQPITPTNFAARDLITEIAALDPTNRPTEITTPWPIQAQGFYTDPQHPNQLHLAYTNPNDTTPATTTPTTGPTPDTPAAQGAAQAAEVALQAPAPTGPGVYPGDNAPKSAIARWMADEAQRRGLPRELPVMAALVESSLQNVPGGDRDSVGYFQMRTGIWDNGPYAGFTHNPELQLKWFLDQAAALKSDATTDPSQYGNWIADVERPAEQYRGRYQLRLDEARQLLAGG